jgi:voltage-gated potassium channel
MRLPTWRAWFDRVLAPAESPPWSNRIVNGLLVGVVLVSVVATVLETLEDTAQRIGGLLRLVEALVVAVMAVEYLLRFWTAPEREAVGARRPWPARLRYATSFVGLVDLLAVLPASWRWSCRSRPTCSGCCACCAFSSWPATRRRSTCSPP